MGWRVVDNINCNYPVQTSMIITPARHWSPPWPQPSWPPPRPSSWRRAWPPSSQPSSASSGSISASGGGGGERKKLDG